MKKIPEKLKGNQSEAIKRSLQISVFNSLAEGEFEESWNAIMCEYYSQP